MSRDKLAKVIDKINQRLVLHGGGVELVDFNGEKNTVKLRLQGACQGCPMAQMTSENFIKKELLRQMPEIEEIEIVG